MSKEIQLVVNRKPIDIAIVQRIEAGDLVKQGNAQMVSSIAEQDAANIILIKSNQGIKAVEFRRKQIVTPLNDEVKNINNTIKEGLRSVREMIDGLKQRTLDFHAELQRKEREAEEAARVEAARRQKILDSHKERGHKTTEITPVPEPEKPTQRSTVRTRKIWTYITEDLSKVPVEFILVDPVAVRKEIQDQVKAGGPMEIPGLKIFQKEVGIF